MKSYMLLPQQTSMIDRLPSFPLPSIPLSAIRSSPFSPSGTERLAGRGTGQGRGVRAHLGRPFCPPLIRSVHYTVTQWKRPRVLCSRGGREASTCCCCCCCFCRHLLSCAVGRKGGRKMEEEQEGKIPPRVGRVEGGSRKGWREIRVVVILYLSEVFYVTF